MNKNENDSLSKTAAKIYLYAYPTAISKRKLSMKIYPESHKDIKKAILRNKLIERNYISYEETKNENGKIIKTGIFSKTYPLLKVIDSRIQGPFLSDFDKHVISTILNSQPFRKFVEHSIDYSKDRVDAIEHILSIFDLVIIMSEKSRPIIEKYGVSLNFKKRDDYDYFIKTVVPTLRVITPDVAKLVTMNPKKRSFISDLNDMALLTVPHKQEKKLRHGVTIVGRYYKHFELLFEGFSNMPGKIASIMKSPQTNKIKMKLLNELLHN